MIKAQLLFTKHTNSFSVNIQNLEELSVKQIQELQSFVESRRGVFDFNTYSFVIQKRLEFQEFLALIKSSEIEAVCKEKVLETKSSQRIEFGKYKGLFYSEVPDSYLSWLKTNYRGNDREILDIELKSRNL
jgi:hypothetical protein